MSDKKIDEMLKKHLLDNGHDKVTEKYICENIYLKEALTASLKLIQNLHTEIERLNANMDVMVKEHERLINNTKTEAIKAFAERLKATFPDRQDSRCTLDDCYTLDIIDNLVKQMTVRIDKNESEEN